MHRLTAFRKGFTKLDGTRSYPATALICSYDKPSTGQTCILQHNEVVILFHELGHGIHDLVAQTRYARFHGASTAADFNEAPSQMLEQWCWLPEIVGRLKGEASGSLQITGVEGLVCARQAKDLVQRLALLCMSLFDLAIGQMQSSEDSEHQDLVKMANEITCKVFGFDTPDVPLPPLPAVEPAYLTVDGMYIYLVYVVQIQCKMIAMRTY